MNQELRHCVYCRRAKRECSPQMRKIMSAKTSFQVRCMTCDAQGPEEGTKEEAEIVWNQNTALTAEAELDRENMASMIMLSEQWNQRAWTSTNLADGLTALVAEVVEKIQTKMTVLMSEYRESLAGSDGIDDDGGS